MNCVYNIIIYKRRERVFLFKNLDGEAVYQLTLDDNTLDMISTGLILSKPYNNTFFSAFEDPNCTFFWHNKSEKIFRIDFPRLDITLQRDEKNRWKTATMDISIRASFPF